MCVEPSVHAYITAPDDFGTNYPGVDPAYLDWDDDGEVSYADAFGGAPALANVTTFYTQLWLFLNGPHLYPNYYPDSDCNALLP